MHGGVNGLRRDDFVVGQDFIEVRAGFAIGLAIGFTGQLGELIWPDFADLRIKTAIVGEKQGCLGCIVFEQAQFDALCSFTFNLGGGALSSSTLLRKLNERDYAGAAEEFPRWCHAGGREVPGLVRRRLAEQSLFKGVWP